MLKVNVASELKTVGRTGRFSGVLEEERVEFAGREVAFASPVEVSVEYIYDGGGFSVIGTAQTKLVSECARCAKAFEEPFGFEFDERFEKATEDEDIYPFSGEELDLTPVVLDNIFLNLPISSICDEDCKGLCLVCGCDLNTSQCSCQSEDDGALNPFSKLSELLKEDKEV